ncbi:hypothetical protein [Clostridium pasteurianum]|uniref:Uncharacterized protein n=1 Tax=Clostridium pasteurianum BC1 TaxID=86416 RepID=R4KAU9_CLOPA|nr:hypothetical protein [Clostridium pasteurianum]AGK97639.1 hypothetical protein Clopa_2801 [Clostridium pasteurianum BC1]
MMNDKIGELLKELNCEFVSENDHEFRFTYHVGKNEYREFMLDKLDLDDDNIMNSIKNVVYCSKIQIDARINYRNKLIKKLTDEGIIENNKIASMIVKDGIVECKYENVDYISNEELKSILVRNEHSK